MRKAPNKTNSVFVVMKEYRNYNKVPKTEVPFPEENHSKTIPETGVIKKGVPLEIPSPGIIMPIYCSYERYPVNPYSILPSPLFRSLPRNTILTFPAPYQVFSWNTRTNNS